MKGIYICCHFSDKLGQLIPSKMTHSKRKGEFVRRILEQYEQISQEDISNHTVSCVSGDKDSYIATYYNDTQILASSLNS